LYGDLDEQILNLTRQQERLILSSLNRSNSLSLTSGLPYPTSLIAFALRHENQTYGVLWAAYDQAHTFSEEEVRFLSTLSSQAAVAAANARLFLSAEIGRQRLAAILASSPDPVLVTDQRNRLLLANPASWQIFGIGMDSDTGQPIDKLINNKDMLDLLLNTTSENRSAEIPIREDKVYLAAVSSVIAEGRRVGRVCVLRDITQLKALDSLKSEFVSTVSHDLRTPLTLMRGYTTMLEMVGQLNDQQTGYVRKIIGGVESMSRLVNNLLDLGRIEAGVGLRPELISSTDVVERVVSVLQIQASQKKIQIKTEFPAQASKLMVEADPALLQQALQNLVENAIKYTKNEGKVTVRVQPQAERVIFEVSDTGIGISPMDQPRLFERFFRLPQAGGQENQGSGLGLAIVRSIAERHFGQVWVESQLGQGSTFYLAIPISQVNGGSRGK
jgi:PAS domain S-box-containing protein